MPRSRVVTSFQKAKPKRRRGRPKGSKTVIKPRVHGELTDMQQWLLDHEGTVDEKTGEPMTWLKLREQYQAECDHSIWPEELVAIQGSHNPHNLVRCTGCRRLLKVTTTV